MTEVALSDLEVRIVKYIGQKRYASARASGIDDQRISAQSNEMTDTNGAGGELAFCKWMNVYPDLQFDERPTHDAVLPCGATVDVKTTHYSTGRLLAPLGKIDKPCDIYFLVVGELPLYRVVGGLSNTHLLNDSRIIDLGRGPGYGASQEDLWDIDRLIHWFTFNFNGSSSG